MTPCAVLASFPFFFNVVLFWIGQAARYGQHKVNLNVSSEKFFSVNYLKELIPPNILARGFAEGSEVYTHDELHELLAYNKGVPVYTTMKRDQTTVMLDRELFEAAPLETQLNLVREETMAMAAERLVVPALLRGRVPGAQPAYRVALAMTLTTHSKGWFRDFGIEHYQDVKNCDVNYVELIQNDGRIKASSEISGGANCNNEVVSTAAAAEPKLAGHAAFVDVFEQDVPAVQLSLGAAVVTSESYLKLMLTRSQVAALVNNPDLFGLTQTRSDGVDDGMLTYACALLREYTYTDGKARYGNRNLSLGATTVLGLGCPIPNTSNNVMTPQHFGYSQHRQQAGILAELVPRAMLDPPKVDGSESMVQYRDRMLAGLSWVARPGAGMDELVTWANALVESADADDGTAAPAAANTRVPSRGDAEVVYILIENAELITSISQRGSGGRYTINSGDYTLAKEDEPVQQDHGHGMFTSRYGSQPSTGKVVMPMYHRPTINSVLDAVGARRVASHAALSKLAKEAVFMSTGLPTCARFSSAVDNASTTPTLPPPKTLREALGLTLEADCETFRKQRLGSKYGPFRWSLPNGVTLELFEKDQCDSSFVDSGDERWVLSVMLLPFATLLFYIAVSSFVRAHWIC